MPEDLEDKGLAEGIDAIDRHTFSKERQPQALANYCSISLISHAMKIMLRVILNHLEAKVEKLLIEEQAGCSPADRIPKNLQHQHLQHQRNLFHSFIDFKKAFDRVWHAGMW